MQHQTISSRARTLALATVLVALTACSAEERFLATAVARQRQANLVATTGGALTDAQLVRLAQCESGGNPRIVSRSGRYMGLYQFDQRTWTGVARRVAPEWANIRPSDAPPEIQNALARTLFAERGRSPWPVCGRRI